MSHPQIPLLTYAEKIAKFNLEVRSLKEMRFAVDRENTKLLNEKKAELLDGGVLYVKIVENILGLMLELKQQFPQLLKSSPIFQKIEDAKWRDDFAKNFHKIFIDRKKQTDSTKFHQFNKVKYYGDEELSNDAVYAESFALGFFMMLAKVYEKFSSQKLADPTAEEFRALLTDFNKILIVKNDDEYEEQDDYMDSCGFHGEFEEVRRRHQIQKQSGGSFLIASSKYSSLLKCFFAFNFGHDKCVDGYYQRYQDDVAQGMSRQDALCKLTDCIGSSVHKFPDGNGRCGILAGWFLAIMHDDFFPILNYPFCFEKRLVEEGKKWTREFLANPQLRAQADFIHEEIMDDIGHENANTDPLGVFLLSLMERDRLLMFGWQEEFAASDDKSLHTLIYEDNTYVVPGSALKKCMDSQMFSEGKSEEHFDLRIFLKAFSPERLEELQGIEDIDEQDDTISLFYFREVQEELKNGHQLSFGEKRLLKDVIKAYNNCDLDKELETSNLSDLLDNYCKEIIDVSTKFGGASSPITIRSVSSLSSDSRDQNEAGAQTRHNKINFI